MLLLIALPAQAKTTLFDTRDEGAAGLLKNTQERTIKDYANIFYANCVAGDPSVDMRDYNKSQCACAAANMPDALNLKQIQALFSPQQSDNRDYAYSRFMTLAYLPCMAHTMRDIVYDDCEANPAYKKLVNLQAVCECIADSQSEYISKHGDYLLPGYSGAGVDWTETANDPLSQVLGSKGFTIKADYNSSVCIQTKSFGW